MNTGDKLSGYARRSKFYRIEYDEKRDIPFYLSFIEQDRSTVLEVPCGAGRLTAVLARKARHVTAIDIEPLMIASLKEHIKHEGLTEKVTARLGDMTSLSLDNKVDVIIVPSEALQLLPQAIGEKALTCLAGLLSDGGTMLVDIATFSEHQAGHPDYFDPKTIGEKWHSQWVRALPDGGLLARDVRIEKNAGRLKFEFKYRLTEAANPAIEFTDEMILHFYDLAWLVRNIPEGISEFSVKSSYSGDDDFRSPSRIIAMYKK